MVAYLGLMLTPLAGRIRNFLFRIDVSFVLLNIFLFASFVLPLLMLYVFEPISFDYLWKGRALYLLFLWLFFLELILGWEGLGEERSVFWTKRMLVAAVGLLLPTIYVLSVFVFGLRREVLELGTVLGVPSGRYGRWYLEVSWPLSFEYLLFTVFFVASVWLVYGIRGLKCFTVSSFFLGAVGVFYMLDTFYPYGTFTVLQFFVPFTVSVATSVLGLLGYGTRVISAGESGLVLWITGADGKSFAATISWPCAGIHSLFIYSFMILLFLRGTRIPFGRKIGYVLVGAVGTFFVNILRIVAIFVAGVRGGTEIAVRFHEFYGEFFFIVWMFVYLSIIFLFETYLAKKISGLRKSVQSSADRTLARLP